MIEEEKLMRNVTVRMVWVMTFLMAGLVAGCGREQAVVQAPAVTATVPASGATVVPVKQVLTATFNVAMDPTTITTSTFTLTGPGGATVAGTVASSGTTATFTPTASLAGSTLYTATITTGAKDVTGNPLPSNYVWTFTTGPIPVVVSTNPVNGATNVSRNQKIIATFSQPMTAAMITAAGTFTVAVTTGGAAVAGTVTYVAATNTATFSPTAILAASTQYTATITTAAQSAAGNNLASNFVWSFTTGLTSDVTPPTITVTNPVSGATGVPTNQTITATFSKVMDSATITAAATFTVTVTTGGAPVAGTVTYAGTTATFTPTANFAANTQFTATITTAAKDLSGNALIAGVVPDPWNFTTGAAADVTPPTITLTSPANAATNVLLNAAVNATFSKALNPTTVTAFGTFTLKVAGSGGAAVAGSVTYNPVSNTATFTPTANLTATTQYTATITNAAKDLAGNALAAGTIANPWTFTTGASVGPTGPNLGTASTFAGATGGSAGLTNSGINTVINGNIGTTAASTLVTGFHDTTVPYIQFSAGCIYTETTLNVGTVNGTIYTAPPPPSTLTCPNEGTSATFAIATQAVADAQTAYNTLAAMPATGDPGANLGGLTLAPGVWKPAGGSLLITGSNLTLDAQGNANAVFVFQMASTLTVGDAAIPRSVILINGAQAKNVFWKVGSAATINGAGGGTMVGTIIAQAGVTFSTAGNATITTLNGRALSLVASITMVNTVINVPAP
jgi:Ice-binding-like/Bacterial Ig-like domain